MLVPAIIYKDELEKMFAKELYTEDYFYYYGYKYGACLPEITANDYDVKYAIVNHKGLIGYFAYKIDEANDTVCNFGLYSFDKGNSIIGIDIYNEFKRLYDRHRRIE